MTNSGSAINSYDTGRQPFKPDKNRSKWDSRNDFSLACIGHCFRLRNFAIISSHMKLNGSIFLLIPYILTLFLFVIPIFFVQSSIGQFSSTGYISAFRVSPIFKGVGYVILLFNFTSVTYYSSMAAYPLLLFFRSFTWELPWMTCKNSWNTPNCTESNDHTFEQIQRFLLVSPTREFLDKEMIKISNRSDPYEISWPVVGALFLIWSLAGLCLLNGIATIGKILRYTTVTTLTILAILFIRMAFLPKSIDYFLNFITPSLDTMKRPDVWLISPIFGSMIIGPGWGSVMTLASYNRFKTDVEKYSMFIPIAMSIIILLSGLMVYFIGEFLRERNIFNIYVYNEYKFEFLWIGIPYFLGTLEASQLWCILMFSMLFLCEMNSVIIQTLSIQTALYDEFVCLRPYKTSILAGICFLLYLLSTFFATNLGVKIYGSLTASADFTQMLICFLEITMIVWVYGRIRFLRDIQFMLGRTFAAWKFYIIRFITPSFVIFLAFIYFIVAFLKLYSHRLGIVFTLVIKVAPWIIIPGYAVYKLAVTTGSLKQRFRKCVRPNDWYPVEACERQRYNEMLGASEVSHQLVELEINHQDGTEVHL